MLGDCICEVDLGEGGRKAITDEVARRARLEIAPGYKDQQKEDGGIGDYLIWRAILQEAATRKVHCIFVTEEEKADWWIKRQGTFQPRPELIDEYRRSSAGRSLHLVPLSGLLATFKASHEVVQQVQDLEEQKKRVVVEVKRRHLLDNQLQQSSEKRKEISHLRRIIDDMRRKIRYLDDQELDLIDRYEKSNQSDGGIKQILGIVRRDREDVRENLLKAKAELRKVSGQQRRLELWDDVSIIYPPHVNNIDGPDLDPDDH